MRYLSKLSVSLFLFASSLAYAQGEKTHKIAIEINIDCPMSEEFKEFVKTIPVECNDNTSYSDWKNSFTTNMTQLIQLVESEKVHNSWWSVKVNEESIQQAKKDSLLK